jgi:tetratricopeptide (TPR) repeat protein
MEMANTRLLVAALLCALAAPVWAQMDMLPFVFRDIPPEIEQGIPQGMSYEEFRRLNRNVDFFSMGMSMIVPGYAMFQVERPALGVPILAGRLGGYGLMAAALVRQWSDLRDLWEFQALSAEQFDSLKINAALMAAGMCLNFVLWGVDVVGAYHIAKEERDYVIYRYGLETAAAGSPEPSLSVLRAQFRRDDRLARPRTVGLALSYLEGRPDSPAFCEVSLIAATLLHRLGRPDEALAHLLRGLAVDPESSHAFAARSLALELLTKYRGRWYADREVLYDALSGAPATRPEDDLGLVELIEIVPRLTDRRLAELLWLFADRYLASSAVPEQGDRVLAALAASFAARRMTEREAAAWAKLVTFYPRSPLWADALPKAVAAYEKREDSAAVARLRALLPESR